MLKKSGKILGVIPARYKSTRFEGKPLALINDIPMIKRTYDQAKKSIKLNELIVATDDQRIVDYCESESIPIIMTSEYCLTGTDRLAEVSTKLDYDLYINIQGDEPIIDPMSISQIIDSYQKYGDEYKLYEEHMSKLAKKMRVKMKPLLLAIRTFICETESVYWLSRDSMLSNYLYNCCLPHYPE